MSTLSLAFSAELSTLTCRGILSKDMVTNGTGWANASAFYSLFWHLCILNNQFMIKLPLISAYFEVEYSIRQPNPKQSQGLYIKQNHQSKIHGYLESEGALWSGGPLPCRGPVSSNRGYALGQILDTPMGGGCIPIVAKCIFSYWVGCRKKLHLRCVSCEKK